MKILKLICIVCILLLSTTAFAEEICTNATTKERISTLEGTFKDRVKNGIEKITNKKNEVNEKVSKYYALRAHISELYVTEYYVCKEKSLGIAYLTEKGNHASNFGNTYSSCPEIGKVIYNQTNIRNQLFDELKPLLGVDSFNLQKAGDCVAFRNKHDHEAVVNSLLKRSTPEGSKSQNGFFDFIVCNPKFSMNPDGTYDYSTIEGRFCKIGDVSELVRRMVKFSIWVAIFAAVVMIVYDAVIILTNRENTKILSIFKKRLWHAIMGVIIILFSYWIIDTLLATINLKETFQFLR